MWDFLEFIVLLFGALDLIEMFVVNTATIINKSVNDDAEDDDDAN